MVGIFIRHLEEKYSAIENSRNLLFCAIFGLFWILRKISLKITQNHQNSIANYVFYKGRMKVLTI